MKFIKKNWGKLIIATYVLTIPAISFAQVNGVSTPNPNGVSTPSSPCPAGTICNPIKNATSVPGLISTILQGVLAIGIPIVALAIIYCGFLFVFARGNSEKLTKAKEALLYTLIGAAILLGAWAIAMMISATVLAL